MTYRPYTSATPTTRTLALESGDFSHEAAERLSRLATRGEAAGRVVIDLHEAREATTSAFARLVRLRRDLLREGRDLCLAGLHDRPARLYEVNRLDAVLPRQ